ncbi:MAG: hypothetical protein K6T73_10380 [Candidatus Bathyarchaeota archaeon]|nr:hypothetical protein [Candidatus Bathyarchaeota archaeon]
MEEGTEAFLEHDRRCFWRCYPDPLTTPHRKTMSAVRWLDIKKWFLVPREIKQRLEGRHECWWQ